MSEGRTKIRVSPAVPLLLALVILTADTALLCALLLAALCHELGHYLVLHRLGAKVTDLNLTVFGAEMRLSGTERISYGGEMLAAAAGPVVNILLASLFALLGTRTEFWFLFAGAQIVLGIFNLLPVAPLDGGKLVWLLLAWCTDPFLADHVCAAVSLFGSLTLLYGGVYLLKYEGGSPFLLLGAVGLVFHAICQMGLVKNLGKG
jgi:stage IV sporulation protein FB